MSSRSRKAQATPPTPDAADTETGIDAFAPDYGRACEVCGSSPCVVGIREGRAVFDPGLCGVCCFGTSEATDPDAW